MNLYPRSHAPLRNLTALLVLLATAATARPDDVYLRTAKDKPSYSSVTVKEESPIRIKLDTLKNNEIAAEDIRDIVYTVEPVSVMVNKYKPAMKAEQSAQATNDPQKKAALYKEAMQLYEDAIGGLKGEQPFVRRHLEFKIATAQWHMAQDLGQPELFKKAFAALAEFRNKHRQGWQIAPCLKMLAQWHMERKEWAAAEQVLSELAQSPVGESLCFEAGLAALDAKARSGKPKDAQEYLEVLAEKQPKGSPANLRIRIVLAECLGYAKKVDQARKIVQEVLKETKDKTLRAQAYNALGVCYVHSALWREASWEFLWVDMIYNQDKKEHAKALYYLAQVFEEMGESDRARVWRGILESNPYQGTLYQYWARQ